MAKKIVKTSTQDLHAAAMETPPSRYLDYKMYLQDVYAALKVKNRIYSYVQYSYDIGLGLCNAAFLIIKGSRPLSLKAASRIARRLGLGGVERQYFLRLVESVNPKASAERAEAMTELVRLKGQTITDETEKSRLSLYETGLHYAVMEILRLPDAEDDPVWIANHLIPPSSEAKVAHSLQLLSELGMLQYHAEKRRLVPRAGLFDGSRNVPAMGRIKLLQELIELGKVALSTLPDDQSIASVLTLAVSPETKQQIISKLAEIRTELEKIAKESGRKKKASGTRELLQLNIQAFPLAKVD